MNQPRNAFFSRFKDQKSQNSTRNAPDPDTSSEFKWFEHNRWLERSSIARTNKKTESHGYVFFFLWQNQRQQAEQQIREEFAEIREFLEKQEVARIALLAEEEEEKLHLMKRNTDKLSRDILMFSHAVRTVDDEIANSDSVFLQVWEVFFRNKHTIRKLYYLCIFSEDIFSL